MAEIDSFEASFKGQVLEKIVPYFRKSDLPSFRLVSKAWNTAVLPRMRELYEVRFEHHSEFGDELIEMEYFIEVYQHHEEHIPFSKYTIAIDRPLHHELVTKFFKIVGPYMTKLTILEYSIVAMNGCHFHELCHQYAPNLQSLVVERGCFFEGYDLQFYEIPEYHTRFFKHHWVWSSKMSDEALEYITHLDIDNLEMVSKESNFAKYNQLKRSFLGNLIKCCVNLKSIRTEELSLLTTSMRDINTLKCLDTFLKGTSKLKMLEKLSELGMRLEEFSLEYEDGETDVVDKSIQVLRNFFSTQEQSLSKCEMLFSIKRETEKEILFAEMKSLKILNPSDVDLFWSQFQWGGHIFSFPKNFPCLRNLSFCNNTVRYWERFWKNDDIPPCLTVNTLKLLGNKLSICANEVRFLAVIFPNVVNLQVIDIMADALRTLWLYWTNVENLTLYLSDTDEEFGYDKYFCGFGNSDWVFFNKLSSFDNKDAIMDRFAFPSLINLSKIYKLKLRFVDTRGIPPCSDIVGYFAIALLPNLKTLNLETSVGISEDCCRDIVKMKGPLAEGIMETYSDVGIFPVNRKRIRYSDSLHISLTPLGACVSEYLLSES